MLNYRALQDAEGTAKTVVGRMRLAQHERLHSRLAPENRQVLEFTFRWPQEGLYMDLKIPARTWAELKDYAARYVFLSTHLRVFRVRMSEYYSDQDEPVIDGLLRRSMEKEE